MDRNLKFGALLCRLSQYGIPVLRIMVADQVDYRFQLRSKQYQNSRAQDKLPRLLGTKTLIEKGTEFEHLDVFGSSTESREKRLIL